MTFFVLISRQGSTAHINESAPIRNLAVENHQLAQMIES